MKYETTREEYRIISAIEYPKIKRGKSTNRKPIAQNCKLAFIFPPQLGGIEIPSVPAKPHNPVMTNSLVISKRVTQIPTLPTNIKPKRIEVKNTLSAIVSRNAPNFEVTFHFLANIPSKKSVQAPINARTAGINISPLSEPSINIKYITNGPTIILNIAR